MIKDFITKISINVLSGIILSTIVGLWTLTIINGWQENYININSVNDLNIGVNDKILLNNIGQKNRNFVVKGIVGKYFSSKPTDYEIGVIVSDGHYVYLQNYSGKINMQDGTWKVSDVILITKNYNYSLFAFVAKSVNEIREKYNKPLPKEEIYKLSPYILSRSDNYLVKWTP